MIATTSVTMMSDGDTVDETCEEADIQNTDSHWVERLFPPTFRLSLQELVHGSITTAVRDKQGHELPAESTSDGNHEDLFVKLARKISPLDVEAIKNVYHRVWLMMNDRKYAQGKAAT